jgi:hypothetical protein
MEVLAMRVALPIAAFALGLALGAALPALAGYTDFASWVDMTSLERLAYVRGVADTLEVAHQMIVALGAERAASMIRRADTCTDPLKLGQVRDIAEEAAAKHQDQSPALSLTLALVACGEATAPSPSAPSAPSQ